MRPKIARISPRLKLETDFLERKTAANPRQREIPDLQDVSRAPAVERFHAPARCAHFSPDHLLDDPSDVHRTRRSGCGELAVAQDGHVIPNREQFLHLMRDVNDGDAMLP